MIEQVNEFKVEAFRQHLSSSNNNKDLLDILKGIKGNNLENELLNLFNNFDNNIKDILKSGRYDDGFYVELKNGIGISRPGVEYAFEKISRQNTPNLGSKDIIEILLAYGKFNNLYVNIDFKKITSLYNNKKNKKLDKNALVIVWLADKLALPDKDKGTLEIFKEIKKIYDNIRTARSYRTDNIGDNSWQYIREDKKESKYNEIRETKIGKNKTLGPLFHEWENENPVNDLLLYSIIEFVKQNDGK